MVAIVDPEGRCLFVNAMFEAQVGHSRRAVVGHSILDFVADAQALRDALAAVGRNAYASGRFDAGLRRPAGGHAEPLPVHVIVSQTEEREHIVVEMIEIEQQTRLDREERTLDQAAATKELIRNLAHEIKNPLGGIRGAAQLLEFELGERERGELREYTQVIIKESDRLQTLVDRLLEPHRHPHIVGDVNIHEVCERVRAVMLAEFPRGLTIERDYDVSVPDLRGDKEQLIQALLNIVRNAAQALRERIAQGDAKIELRTRIARKVTIAKRLYRLALDLHVIDNGPGIPEEIRDRIFYPLVSGRDDGSGLGLTLAQTFVQQHDGMIEVESRPGRTEFQILLPLDH